MPVEGRERKVDVNKLTLEQADGLSIQIGDKIKQITDRAVAEANSFLNIYGITCQMQIVIEERDKPLDELNARLEKNPVKVEQDSNFEKLDKARKEAKQALKKPSKPRAPRKSKAL